MAIDALRDGVISMCFDTSANVVTDSCQMVVEGQMLATGTATPDQLLEITSDREFDDLFGEGSVIAEGLRTALSCCGRSGVRIVALPRMDAATAVAAAYEMAITGPATSDGRVDIYMGETRWNISARVRAGDTETEIADAIVGALHESFPYTAVNAAGTITFTAKNAGTVGNVLVPVVNWHGRMGYLPEGVSFTTTQTVVGATDPVAPDYESIFGECCICAYALMSGNEDWQDSLQQYIESKWSCDQPQCFGHAYVYNRGSLGQVLAADTNAAVFSRMAESELTPLFPYLKVVAYAAVTACRTLDNPELNIQGNDFGRLDCLSLPETCGAVWTFDEITQLGEAGFVVTLPESTGGGALTVPYIIRDITNNRFDENNRENFTFRAVSARRLAVSTAIQFAELLNQFKGPAYYKNNTKIREGTIGLNKNAIEGTIRSWLRSQEGILFSAFENLDRQLIVQEDFEVAARCQGTPGLFHIALEYSPPQQIVGMNVTAIPKTLSNC